MRINEPQMRGNFQLRTELIRGESMELNNGLGPEAIRDMTSERERLRIEVAELRKQLDEAQRQVEVWQEKYRHSEEQVALLDRDWHSMFRLLPREWQVTEEDILEFQRDPHTFEELWGLFEQHESKEEAFCHGTS